MTTLIAYHGKPELKKKYVARVRAHRKMDAIIQGTGWDKDNKKGCAIGCTLEDYDHSRYPVELGIPESIARLEDRIFEGLPIEYARKWPQLVLQSIHVGADLSLVTPKILLWILLDEKHGSRQHCDEQGKAATDLVADVLRGWVTNGHPNQARAVEAAEAAAWAAAWAAEAAEAAARAAEAARAAGAAGAEFYIALGTELLRILKSTTPTQGAE